MRRSTSDWVPPDEHQDVAGTAFAVWAPSARAISFVGDFNSWDGRLHPCDRWGKRRVGTVPPRRRARAPLQVRDPWGRRRAGPEGRPVCAGGRGPAQDGLGGIPHRARLEPGGWGWLTGRRPRAAAQPVSIYEVHLGSWRLNSLEGNRPLYYPSWPTSSRRTPRHGLHPRRAAANHGPPVHGSWGYQVTGYYAPTPRYGHPTRSRVCAAPHESGVGVILDWVPAHFPRDQFALARFDGTALYEHADPRRGAPGLGDAGVQPRAP